MINDSIISILFTPLKLKIYYMKYKIPDYPSIIRCGVIFNILIILYIKITI